MKNKKFVIWFTGLSGAGKSTLSSALKKRLDEKGLNTFLLDGDIVRTGLCQDLGFSKEDRTENIRRIGEVCKILVEANVSTIAAFISPVKSDRDNVRKSIDNAIFVEVYCNSSLKVCESRDVKGLYKKARNGEIPEFTGISSSYEAPDKPELALDTANKTIVECIDEILQYLENRIDI